MKKVLITGGAGDIGLAIGKKLAEHGFEVFPLNRYQLDVTDPDSIEKVMAKIKPDILINCAGYIEPQSLCKLSYESLTYHLNINLIGAIMCAKYAVLNGATQIINIGSSAGVNPKAGWLAYCVSKSALTMFTECLIKEGINCLTLHIGRTDTKMRSKLFPGETKELLMSPESVAEAVLDSIDETGVVNVRKITKSWEFFKC